MTIKIIENGLETTPPQTKKEQPITINVALSKYLERIVVVRQATVELGARDRCLTLIKLTSTALASYCTPSETFNDNLITISNHMNTLSLSKETYEEVYNALYSQLQTLWLKDPPKWVKIFALTQVNYGATYEEVAQALEIKPKGKSMHKILMFAVDGPAGKQVLEGKSYLQVAEAFGIPAGSKAMKALWMLAVNGPAGRLVLEGKPCREAAETFGIPEGSEAMKALWMFAVNGPAGKLVLEGKSCREAAKAFGIPEGSKAMKALWMLAVNGPAGKLVLKGKSCRKVAKAFGISERSKAMDALQEIAVYGPAGERARNGAPYIKVAEDFGIDSGSKAMLKLQAIAVWHSAENGSLWVTTWKSWGLELGPKIWSNALKLCERIGRQMGLG